LPQGSVIEAGKGSQPAVEFVRACLTQVNAQAFFAAGDHPKPHTGPGPRYVGIDIDGHGFNLIPADCGPGLTTVPNGDGVVIRDDDII
jgi:hypothetical protein